MLGLNVSFKMCCVSPITKVNNSFRHSQSASNRQDEVVREQLFRPQP